MKRVFSFLLFITAISCFAGTPSYMDWAEIEDTYIPISGLTFKWASGGSFSTKFEIPKDATASDIYSDLIALIQNKENPIPDNARNAFAMAAGALAQAIHSSKKATVNTKMIKQLAASIETLVGLTAADKVDSYGRVISKGNIDSMRAKVLEKKNSIASGGSSSSGGGSASDPIQIKITEFNYDLKEFEQRTDLGNNQSKMALKGYKDLTGSETGVGGANGWALASRNWYLPYADSKDGSLGWKRWNGWDSTLFSAGDDSDGCDNDSPLRLRYWRSGSSGGCENTLSQMMTDKRPNEQTARSTHKILTRYQEGSGDPEVHWLPMGDVMEGGDTLTPDEVSVIVEVDDETGATNLCVYGFKDANASALEDEEPYVPYVDGEGELGWTGFSTFFADTVFKKSETTGKILLNGTTEEGKVKVLTLTGSGEDDQTLGTLDFDNTSIDGNPSIGAPVQLHAFNTAPSPYTGTQNFADALTNTAVTIQGMSVPVRVPDQSITGGYAVKYIPMGKVTGVPAAAVDQKTITIDDEDADNPKLQIIDAKTTEKGYVLKMGDDHTAGWQKLASDDSTGLIYPQGVGSGSERHEPIEITDHNDGTYGIGLRNWDTETQDFIYGAKDANPTQIKFDETIEVNDEEEIEIAGYSDADVGSMAYKASNGLGWLTLPSSGSALLSLTKNSTPEAIKIGESLQKETVGGDKVVNVKNFTSGGNCNVTLSKMLSDPNEGSNRADHQLMARYSSGGSTPSVHWVSIGSVIGGGGAPVDGVSITTNTTEGAVAQGDASMRGYSQQSQGAIPFKGASNLQWIAPPSSGNAVVTMSANSATKSTLGDSLEINSSTLNVTGYSGANNGYVPSKNGNGISWIIPVTGVKTDNGAPLTTVDENNTRKIAMTAAAGASSASPKALLSDGATIYWGSQSGGGNVKVDNVTISTNEVNHAGQLAVKGAYDSANVGKALFARSGGGTEWKNVSGGVSVDNVTISTNETGHAGELAIKGAYSSTGRILVSNGSGGPVWMTNGDGITISADYNTISVNKGQGIDVDSSTKAIKAKVKTNGGLSLDNDGLSISCGSSVEVNQYNSLNVKLRDSSSIGGGILNNNSEGLGFANAGIANNSVLMKTANGIEWVTAKSVDVIVGSEYDTTTHTFKNKKKSLLIICPNDTIPETEDVSTPVFTAVAHDVN